MKKWHNTMYEFKDYHKHLHTHYHMDAKWPSIAFMVVAVLVVWYLKTLN